MPFKQPEDLSHYFHSTIPNACVCKSLGVACSKSFSPPALAELLVAVDRAPTSASCSCPGWPPRSSWSPKCTLNPNLSGIQGILGPRAYVFAARQNSLGNSAQNLGLSPPIPGQQPGNLNLRSSALGFPLMMFLCFQKCWFKTLYWSKSRNKSKKKI